MTRQEAFRLINAERDRQQAKWGDQNHDDGTWLQILTEEVGEYSEACLHWKFGGPKGENRLKELIQTAAIAVQMLEKYDLERVPPTKVIYEERKA